MATTKLNKETVGLLRAKELNEGLTKLKPYTYKLDEKSDAVKEFELVTKEMGELFAKKNKDYGNSFERSLDEDGPLVSKIRLGDKYSRFSALVKSPEEQQVKDESIRDTLIDMANYAVMTLMWLDRQKELEAIGQMHELIGNDPCAAYVDQQIVNEIRVEENAK